MTQSSHSGYGQSPLNVDYSERELLRMNLNENIVFPRNVMRTILAKCTDEFDPRIYPPAIDEAGSMLLNREIAKYCGISSSSVAIGAGADQLIDLLFRMFLTKRSDAVVVVSPTFPMYPIFAKQQRVVLKEVWLNPSTAADPFSLPVSKVKQDYKRQTNAKLLVIVSPNNPTGIQYPIEQLEEILEEVPDKPVLLDEAYLEYAKYDAAKRFLNSHKNLLVLRSFSKAFALASLRLGYVLSSDVDLIRRFNESFQYPYPVTGLSLSMGIELLGRKKIVLQWADKTKIFRDELISSLQKFAPVLRVIPKSDTNFVLVQAKGSKRIADELLAKYAIAVRYFPDLGKEKKEFLRITVGSAEANSRLLFALRRIIS